MTHAEQLERTRNIDIALSVLDIIRPTGIEIPGCVIAHICGCSPASIWKIEQNAIAKLRKSGRLKEFIATQLLPSETNSINSLSGANQ